MVHEIIRARSDYVGLHDRHAAPVRTHLVDGSKNWQMAIDERKSSLFPIQT
jgi:hypothetical protein